MTVKKELIDNFGDKIESELKTGFCDYDSGNEGEFIEDFLETLDNTVTHADGQHLHVKIKNIHGYPQADFDTGVNSHPDVNRDIVDQIQDKTPEIADLLVIANIYENRSVTYRQAFFSQAKCISKSKIGYQYWKIDPTQYYFLHAKPKFELTYKDSTESFDLRGVRGSTFNYSFVGDVHRPFFYRPNNMSKYMKKMSRYHRFIYGTHPVSGFRLPISVLKMLLYGRYGQRFKGGSEFYNLIREIYEHATLADSKSRSILPDGGGENIKNNNIGMGIIEMNVDADGSFDGEIPPPDENGLRIENISRE